MISFTIKNTEIEPYKIYTLPYEIIEHSQYLTAEKQRCKLNGYELNINDRVVVRGEISSQLPVALHREWAENIEDVKKHTWGVPEDKRHTWVCCFHWDGYSLTSFPEKAWIENCQSIIYLNAS